MKRLIAFPLTLSVASATTMYVVQALAPEDCVLQSCSVFTALTWGMVPAMGSLAGTLLGIMNLPRAWGFRMLLAVVISIPAGAVAAMSALSDPLLRSENRIYATFFLAAFLVVGIPVAVILIVVSDLGVRLLRGQMKRPPTPEQ